MHPYILTIPRTKFKITLSLPLEHSRTNTPYHTTISFPNSNHEDSRALHGDFKLVRRFGGDFK
ncbi:hypothetical protein Hanom_Chr12g01146401 [Helianthus anomalus]